MKWSMCVWDTKRSLPASRRVEPRRVVLPRGRRAMRPLRPSHFHIDARDRRSSRSPGSWRRRGSSSYINADRTALYTRMTSTAWADDRGIEDSSLIAREVPRKTVPQRNPMQVLEGGDHEGVEGKRRGRWSIGRRKTSERQVAPHARFQRSEPPQHKPAKIKFHKQRDPRR